MIGFGRTDVGRHRPNNEDAFFVSNEPVGALDNLYIVADGMGGHNAGEVASNNAIKFFCEHIMENSENSHDAETLLYEALIYANKMVFDMSMRDKTQYGMGTTLTACTIQGGILSFAHVGDSRLYIINGAVTQITEDHSLVNEMLKDGKISKQQANVHPQRNILTRVLGTEEFTEADRGSRGIQDGDMMLICSDGLINMVSDADISRLINSHKTNEDAVAALIDAANNAGGADNISVILIRQG